MPTHYTSSRGPVESLPTARSPEPTQDPMTTSELLRWVEPTHREWLAVLEVAYRMEPGLSGERGYRGGPTNRGPMGELAEELYGGFDAMSPQQSRRLVALSRLALRLHRPVGRKQECAREGCEVRFPPTVQRHYCSDPCRNRRERTA